MRKFLKLYDVFIRFKFKNIIIKELKKKTKYVYFINIYIGF